MGFSTSLWSSLPIDVLCQVIEQVEDKKTLDAICEATRFNTILYSVSLRQRWRAVRISEFDFLIAPHRYDRPNHDPDSLVTLVMDLTGEIGDKGLTPAAYIQCLSFNFDFQLTDDAYGDLPEDYEHDYSEDITYEEVDHNLVTLFRHLRSVTQIDFDGVLYQGHLERITDLDVKSLRSLKLRQSHGFLGLRRTSAERLGPADLCLRWDSLARLSHLQRLEIGEIIPDEAASLAHAISKLGRLQKLVAAAGPGYDESRWHGTPKGSLYCFLDTLFPSDANQSTNRSCGLPASLKSLALTDCISIDRCITFEAALTDRSTDSAGSADLYLDGIDAHYIKTVLTACPISHLSRLAVPSSALFDSLFTIQTPSVAGSQHPGSSVFSVIENRATLKSITLLDIWGLDICQSRQLDSLLDELFTTEDLVLGTRTLPFYLPFRSSIPSSMTQDFYGYVQDEPPLYDDDVHRKEMKPRWSKRLQRIRIDQIEFTDEKFEPLVKTDFPELRILMLRPWKTFNSGFLRSNGKGSHDFLFSVQVPGTPAQKAEYLASRILEKGLPKLQALILGGYWFWISASKLWRFSDAQSDPIQSKLIARLLSRRDWSFLRETYPPPEKVQDPHLIHRVPASEVIRRRNYIVLYRRDGNDAVNQKVSSSLGSGWGTSMMEVAAWVDY